MPISEADLTRLHETDQRARAFTKIVVASLFASKDVGPVERFIDDPRIAQRVKAAQSVMSGADFGAGLLSESRAWLNIARRREVIGQLNGALAAPANVSVPTPTSDPVPQWVAEMRPVPFARVAFDNPRTESSKFGFAVGFDESLVRFADPRVFDIVERVSMRAAVRASNALFLSDDAAVSGANPAGILFGVSPSGAGSPPDLQEQLEAQWTDVSDGAAVAPYYVLSARIAIHMATMHVDGTPVFPNIGPLGGSIFGVPAIIAREAGNKLILLDAAQLVVTDDGLTVSPSRDASVQMTDTPTDGPESLISAFQVNMLVVKFVRYLHWIKLASDAVAYIEFDGIDGSPS